MKVLWRSVLQFLKYTIANLENCRFRENLTFYPQNWGKFWFMIKNAPPIASTRREQSAIFPLSPTTLSFEKRGGRGVVSTPHPAHPRYEIGLARHGRGLKSQAGTVPAVKVFNRVIVSDGDEVFSDSKTTATKQRCTHSESHPVLTKNSRQRR